MTTVYITEADGDLFQYRDIEKDPYGGELIIDTSDGEITACVSDPDCRWRPYIRSFALPCLTRESANELLRAIMPLAQSLLDVVDECHDDQGAEISAISDLEEAIEERCRYLPTVEFWDACTYLDQSSDKDLGIWAHTEDVGIEEIAVDLVEAASHDGITLDVNDVEQELIRRRDALDENPDRLTEAAWYLGQYLIEPRWVLNTIAEGAHSDDLDEVAQAVVLKVAISHGTHNYASSLAYINALRINADLEPIKMKNLCDDYDIVTQKPIVEESTYTMAKRISSEVTSEEILPLALQGKIAFTAAALAAERINTVKPISVENCYAILNDHRLDNDLDPIMPHKHSGSTMLDIVEIENNFHRMALICKDLAAKKGEKKWQITQKRQSL
jgi:hypothetical protein